MDFISGVAQSIVAAIICGAAVYAYKALKAHEVLYRRCKIASAGIAGFLVISYIGFILQRASGLSPQPVAFTNLNSTTTPDLSAYLAANATIPSNTIFTGAQSANVLNLSVAQAASLYSPTALTTPVQPALFSQDSLYNSYLYSSLNSDRQPSVDPSLTNLLKSAQQQYLLSNINLGQPITTGSPNPYALPYFNH